ncbi:hypothetical protein J6590_071326 [Homalodisca vitripennis]|nr:hypothetical protein J6590_071326 [Homalodisca vitripennis]
MYATKHRNSLNLKRGMMHRDKMKPKYALEDYIYDVESRSLEPSADPEDVYAQLQQKEKDLILAAELGKALLEKNEELSRQNERLAEEYSQKLEPPATLRSEPKHDQLTVNCDHGNGLNNSSRQRGALSIKHLPCTLPAVTGNRSPPAGTGCLAARTPTALRTDKELDLVTSLRVVPGRTTRLVDQGGVGANQDPSSYGVMEVFNPWNNLDWNESWFANLLFQRQQSRTSARIWPLSSQRGERLPSSLTTQSPINWLKLWLFIINLAQLLSRFKSELFPYRPRPRSSSVNSVTDVIVAPL